MSYRRSTFETLEKRKLLNADPVVAAPSEPTENEVRGLLRYQVGNSLLATQSWANEDTQRQEAQGHEVQQHWPSPQIADAWRPVLSADFSGDGQVDTLGTVESISDPFVTPKAWLQINNGTGFYLLPWGDALPADTEVVGHGDVNGDGLNDIVSFNSTTNEVWVSVNSPAGGFRNELWTRWSEALATEPFVADFDLDGLTDVLVGTRSGRWLLGRSEETRFVPDNYGSFSVFDWRDMVTGDFNGDGRPDVAGRAPDRTWWVWQGRELDGEQRLDGAKYWGHWKMGTGWSDVRVADFNADGLDDLLGRSAEGTLHVATAVKADTGEAAEFHSWRWVTGWVTGADWRNMTIADITQDGLPDVVGQAKDNTWWAAENIGNNFRNFFLDRMPVEHVAVADTSRSTSTTSEQLLHYLSPSKLDSQSTSLPEESSSPLRVQLKDDGHLVVEGNGQQVRAIEFRSPSGSLIPIGSFGSTGFNQLNRNEHVNIRLSAEKPVTIDGELVLGVKWDHTTAANDLQVVYDVVNVRAAIDLKSFESNDDREAEPENAATTEYELYEQYLSIYPDAFASVVTDEVQIPDETQNSNEEVVADSDETEPSESEFVASSVEEENEETADSPSDTETAEPDVESHNDESASEQGHEVESEPDGATEQETEPSVVESPSESVVYPDEATGSEASETIAGDETAVESEPEVTDESDSPAIEPDSPALEQSPVELTLSEDNQFLLNSPELSIYALRIESPRAGLVVGSMAEPFDSWIVADSGLVVYASETPVTGESLPLNLHWKEGEATDELFAEYGIENSEWHPVFLFDERLAKRDLAPADIAPVDQSEAAEIGEGSEKAESEPISIHLNEENQFVIAASNQRVLGMNFRSENSGLVPGSSPLPFELFVVNSKKQIALGTFGRLVTVDGEVTLDFGWDGQTSIDDLVIELGDEDGDVLRLHSDCEQALCEWSL